MILQNTYQEDPKYRTLSGITPSQENLLTRSPSPSDVADLQIHLVCLVSTSQLMELSSAKPMTTNFPRFGFGILLEELRFNEVRKP